MKLATIDDGGSGRLGAQLASGAFVDLRRAARAQTLEAWLPGSMIALLEAGGPGLEVVAGIVRRVEACSASERARHAAERVVLPPDTPLLAPVPNPRLIVAAGMAYRAHAEEMADVPPIPHPTVFTKAPGSVIGHDAAIPVPPDAPDMVDFEGELACVIGSPCHRASPPEALACIAGYTAANDVSARNWLGKVFGAQTAWEGRWTWEQNILGKQFPGFTPLGPVMTTADEIGDPSTLSLSTRLNGERMQHTSVSDLVYDVGETVSYYSQWYRLLPGDIVLTGTPAGVGAARKPPLFMRDGDVVEVEIGGIGILRNRVAGPRPDDRAPPHRRGALQPSSILRGDQSMKRIAFDGYGGPDVMYVQEFTPPPPGPHDVVVAVKAAAINPIDWKLRRGDMRHATGEHFPRAMGAEFAGVIAQVGAAVTDLQPGDAVVGATTFADQGAFAEAVLAPAARVAKKPPELSFVEATGVALAGVTAWLALVKTAGLKAGQTVLINGALGGVGHAAVTLANGLGARVTGRVGPRSVGEAAALGMARVLDYSQPVPAELEGTFDVVFDVNGSLAPADALALAKPAGLVADINPSAAKLQAAQTSERYKIVIADGSRENLEAVLALAAAGRLRSPVGRTCPFAEAIPLIAALERGERVPGRSVITFG